MFPGETMSQVFDAIVIGGGVVGLSAALAMALRDYRVAVIDANVLDIDAIRPNLRVYALNHASINLLQQLGVWDLMDAACLSPYRHMHVRDAASKALIEFDARMIAASKLGVIVEESLIKRALLQRIALDNRIELFSKHLITSVNTDKMVTVKSESQQWMASLLMVADGGESPTRQLLQAPMTIKPYHQQALVVTVRTEKPHQYTAWQRFNPDGPLAFLPLVDMYRCSVVWSTTPARALWLADLPEEVFNQEITRAFDGLLGVVSLDSPRHQFPLIMRHVRQYAGKNWLIMGDAAHTIHPLAGLGLNLGLADVTAWINYLDASYVKAPNAKLLGAYQRQRRYEVSKIIALMGSLHYLFTNPLSPVIGLRGLGLNVCNQLTPLKRFLIEQAAG